MTRALGPAVAVALALVAVVPAEAPSRAIRDDPALVVVPGQQPAASGTGRLRRFQVEVERGIAIDRQSFARTVVDTLFDRRSWQSHGRVRFEWAAGGPVSFRVTLARPATVDRLCAPLHTAGRVSCFQRGRAVLNIVRWTQGSPIWRGRLADYRHYMVNHEVGHALGEDHRICRGPGRLAFVMTQQTGVVAPCRTNPWPLPLEQTEVLDGCHSPEEIREPRHHKPDCPRPPSRVP